MFDSISNYSSEPCFFTMRLQMLIQANQALVAHTRKLQKQRKNLERDKKVLIASCKFLKNKLIPVINQKLEEIYPKTAESYIFEYAALCLDVYREKFRPILPQGWSIFADSPPNSTGYFGSCYIKTLEKDSYEVCFAHKGTVKWSPKDWHNDLQIALENVPLQYNSALQFVNSTISLLQKKYGKDNLLILHSGHSLGSIFSEIFASKITCTQMCYLSFESPGSKPILQKLIDQGSLPPDALFNASINCNIFNTDVDIINTCNEQVTVPYYIPIPYTYEVFGGPITIVPQEYYLNYYYICGYTFGDQHKIENIYNYLKAHTLDYQSWIYESGFATGYDGYLDYGVRKDYWNGYIKEIWDTHPEIQEVYKGKFADYLNYFIKTYLNDCKIKQQLTVKNQQLAEEPSLIRIAKMLLFHIRKLKVETETLTKDRKILLNVFEVLKNNFEGKISKKQVEDRSVLEGNSSLFKNTNLLPNNKQKQESKFVTELIYH